MAKNTKSSICLPDEISKAKEVRHFNAPQNDWTDFLLPNFKPPGPELHKNTWRVTTFLIVAIFLFFIMFLRLFHLQIVQGKVNRGLADGNRIQIKVIHAPRGVIYDRNGRILAASAPAFRLNDFETHKTRLITREEALEWEVKEDPRFLNLEVDSVRTYPMGEKFAHVLGLLGEISTEDLNKEKFSTYKSGDQIGQTGVEAEYENLLRGVDGGEIIEVDSKGAKIRTLRLKKPVSGKNIYLSIDASVQERLYDLMIEALSKAGSCCGAAVAQDPKSGQILALVSLPSFDPNIFAQRVDDSSIRELLSDSDSPLLNRVIGGTYPPGSTFKIISSLAALSSGKVGQSTTVEDTGIMYLGPYKFTNWYYNQYGKVEGSVNLLKALQRSNDTYFYKISQIIGKDILVDWARKLQLGKVMGIDLPGEQAGLVPDETWKQKKLNLPWYPGDTLHMSIGQGFVLTTPLQILGATSFIASEGTFYKPTLLLSDKPKIKEENLLPKDTIRVVKEGLKLVPKYGGTAWPFFTFPIETAGKTGTAEYGDAKGRTHAWYTAFAPSDDPKIVLTVLIEGGGEGSSVAAPVAKELFRFYFSPDKSNLIKDVYTPATDSGRTLGE